MTLDDARELLDAYLDDELTSGERQAVDEALAGSAELRAELESVAAVRAALRGLPEVEPPPGTVLAPRATDPPAARFSAAPCPPRRRSRRAPVPLAAMAALAAAVVLVVTLTPALPRLAPPLADLAHQHEAVATAAEPMPGFAPVPSAEVEAMAAAGKAPASLPAGFALMGAYRSGEVVQLLYQRGDEMVSVFEQPGRLAGDGAPPGSTAMEMHGEPAWVTPMDGGEVLVVQHDGMVYTVVGGVSHDDMLSVGDAMPAGPGTSLGSRARAAVRDLAEAFGFPPA